MLKVVLGAVTGLIAGFVQYRFLRLAMVQMGKPGRMALWVAAKLLVWAILIALSLLMSTTAMFAAFGAALLAYLGCAAWLYLRERATNTGGRTK